MAGAANNPSMLMNLNLQRQAAANGNVNMRTSGSIANVASNVQYNPSHFPTEGASASSALAASPPNQNMSRDIIALFGDFMHVSANTKEPSEMKELSRKSTLAYESLANFALSAPNASTMTACRTCEKVDIAQAQLRTKAGSTTETYWKPIPATCASNMGLLEFYFTWFRFAWWVNMWVQMFIQDAYMSLLSIVIIFGCFAFFELVFLIGASHVYFRSVRSSYFSSNVYFVQWLLFLIAVFATASTANIYQSSKNKAGFNFEIALPSGTGVSTNDAFNQGTQILAIPTNVYVNIQLFVTFGVWIGVYFLLFAAMGHVVRHSRHPDKHALY